MTTLLLYAGIGSRKTPPPILKVMTALAQRLAELGYILRSGGADGADSAFEEGCQRVSGQCELWLPWAGFNGRSTSEFLPHKPHFEVASTVHPAWGALKSGAKALHARNVGQVLGADVATPVSFVVCYTPDGAESAAQISRETGGTATAIRLASERGIPVFNLANHDARDRLFRFVLAQNRKFHPDRTAPNEGDILVFGSNLAGRHGAGSAKLAADRFGAKKGQGVGASGQSYAIPTKDGREGRSDLSLPTAVLGLDEIRGHVDGFIAHARAHAWQEFFVVRVGCGLAGYKDEDIAPMFALSPLNCSFPQEWSPWLGIK